MFVYVNSYIILLIKMPKSTEACLSKNQPYIKPEQCSSTNYLLAKISSLEDKHL